MQVKICGITNLEDAKLAVDFGADTLGFLFFDKSPRSISYEIAKRIIQRLPAKVIKVGVFVEQKTSEVKSISRELDLNYIQLHGNQKIENYEEELESVIKVLKPELSAIKQNKSCHILADSSLGFEKVVEVTQESHLKSLSLELENELKKIKSQLILSGNLTVENVSELIKKFQPKAVDIARAVERKPGKKCPQKLKNFVLEAKNAFKELRR